MALGGGVFITQNKVLPGSYMNFVSAARATAALSERGTATVPIAMEWGPLGEVAEVSAGEFQLNSMGLFGLEYTAPELRGLRELFRNVRTAYLYRMGTGGAKATNGLATAKHAGTRGNELKVTVIRSADDADAYEVSLYLGGVRVFAQTAADMAGLADNPYVDWKRDGVLEPTAGTPLAGGESPEVTNGDYQRYLDRIEPFSFNAMGCPSGDPAVKALFAAFTKRMRDEQGVKFVCVAQDCPADHEGVINVMNQVRNGEPWGLVYWVTGLAAGTAVNKSAMNRVYDGEMDPEADYTQTQLERAIKGGLFALHRVGPDIRVLADINSLVNVTADKGEDFKQNQTVRVIDQIANDIAVLFNTKYLGAVPNDEDGRISLWADIVKHHEQLQTIRAIEGFSGENVRVTLGANKRAVTVHDAIEVVNAMGQIYMTVTVS